MGTERGILKTTHIQGFSSSQESPTNKKSHSTKRGKVRQGKTYKLTSSPLQVLHEGKIVDWVISLSARNQKGLKMPKPLLLHIARELTPYLQTLQPLLWR